MLLTVTVSLCAAGNDNQAIRSSFIIQLEINDVIGPATADYLERNIQKAIDQQAVAILIRMDTSGGLDVSMRQIIKQIIASPILGFYQGKTVHLLRPNVSPEIEFVGFVVFYQYLAGCDNL